MQFREKDLDLRMHLWDKEAQTLAPLLAVSSQADASAEPRWLSFCDYLALAFRQGEAIKASAGWEQEALQELADQIWGPEAMSADELAQAWFALPDVEEGKPHHGFACRETAQRAVAIAELAGRRYGWRNESVDPDAWLTALEQKALKHFWANRYGPEDDLRMPVLLVNESAAVGEKGRRAQLRFYTVKVEPALHGQLFRAPGAALLSLQDRGNNSFEEGLEKGTTLLKACLKPAEGEQSGLALMWSLHPEPMVLDRVAELALKTWGAQPITGASATGAFAIGALWVLRNELRVDLPGMALAQKQLRAIHPGHLAISAQLEGLAPPDMNAPLKWLLAPVKGLDEKLATFVLDRQLQTAHQKTVFLALVAKGQDCDGDEDEVTLESAKDLAQALESAYSKVGAPLPEAGEALWRFLLDVPFEQTRDEQGRLMDEAQPITPVAPTALIQPLRSETMRSTQHVVNGPNRPEDIGKPNAIAWYLLRCYAQWAGGDHLLWGEPARLAEDFYPIKLEPLVDEAALRSQAELTGAADEKFARSLIELLDTRFLPKQPPVWVLAASPAAGKTTMMAEFQMYHAYKALRYYARSGHFGVVPLWIPARALDLKDPISGSERTLDQAIAAWLRIEWPALGFLQSLLICPHAHFQVLLDGINELRCEADTRATLLADWLATYFGPMHTHRSPLLTVRSLELFRPQGAQVANLKPWDRGQRIGYVHKRLDGHPVCLDSMLTALDVDENAADGDLGRMLYSSPGLLSLACTLMVEGLLVPDPEQRPMNRARLLSTLIWSRLKAEDQNPNRNIPRSLLGREEKRRLQNLIVSLKEGDWRPPEKPGLLLSALAEQARHMQFDRPSAEIELPEPEWWSGIQDNEQRFVLTQAAGHLGVVQSRRGVDKGRDCDWVGYRHQLFLEYFATYGLTPDGTWPENVAAPLMKPICDDYDIWFRHRQARENKNMGWLIGPGEWEVDRKRFDLFNYQLQVAEISVHEEPIKLAAQLRGNIEDWISRLIEVGNAPLAARLALENWVAFGEPGYPQEDPLGPWRPQRKKGEKNGGTDPNLNVLRQALFDRMEDLNVHLASRVEAGELLGRIGGSPLYEICGDSLILKDKYWVPIGEEGQTLSFEMGDLEGDSDELTVGGTLYRVEDLPAFRMAGYLVTNAQYRCFAQSGQYQNPAWWPGVASRWLDLMVKHGKEAWMAVQSDIERPGLAPLAGNFWQVQAYALWEQAQREKGGRGGDGWVVSLPTESQWECGARWTSLSQQDHAQSQNEEDTPRWRFAHTPGQIENANRVNVVRLVDFFEKMEKVRFVDVNPWDFNHRNILGLRSSPVGVFVESNARNPGWPVNWALRDLAGNVWEWCASKFDTPGGKGKLGKQVEWVAEGQEMCAHWEADSNLTQVEWVVEGLEMRALRGGSFDCTAGLCRVGSRVGDAPRCVDDNSGFRLVMVEAM